MKNKFCKGIKKFCYKEVMIKDVLFFIYYILKMNN